MTVAAGEYMFAYQLSKVLFNVLDIGVTKLFDAEASKKKWDTYMEPVNTIIDAIAKKEVSLRDAVKLGTQFAVQWKAEGKLLDGMGKLYKKAKASALDFIDKNPKALPEEYLATPEGYVFRAHERVHKLSTQGSEKLGGNTKEINNPAHSVVQYEKLKQALNEEQYTSIIKCTKHGLERLIERFTPQAVSAVVKNFDFTKIQNDGSTAYIKKIGEKYAVIAVSAKTDAGVITGVNNLNLQDLKKLGKNYGWEL